MHEFIQYFPINLAGNDYVVGDIHGCFSQLKEALDIISFNPQTDRLFCVGDLIDRGPESQQALEWLIQPWFHTVRGNHEAMAIQGAVGQGQFEHTHGGGGWFYELPHELQLQFKIAFEQLPYLIEVQTPLGPVGITHADCPYNNWNRIREEPLDAVDLYCCQWSRERLTNPYLNNIDNIHAVIQGHSLVAEMLILGNIYFIETGGWLGNEGHWTFLDLHTLEATTV